MPMVPRHRLTSPRRGPRRGLRRIPEPVHDVLAALARAEITGRVRSGPGPRSAHRVRQHILQLAVLAITDVTAAVTAPGN